MTKPQNAKGIALQEFVDRRARVLKALNGAAAIVFAGEGAAPLLGKWRANPSFFYLTGIDNEPGAAVLFQPAAEMPSRRIALLLRPLNPEVDRWDGYRDPINSQLKNKTGFAWVARSDAVASLLTAAARQTKRLACLHPFSVYPAAVSADLAVFKQVCERVPGVAIEDKTQLLASLRAVKSAAELRLMKSAISATAAGYKAAMAVIRPGATEAAVAQAMERTYVDRGASGVAYNSIVGAGLNSTVLHYMDNTQPLEAGDLMVIDSGARFSGYAADVTRTYPVSGRFSDEQREAYEVVLRAQLAAIKAARPGARMADVDAAARNVIDNAGLGDFFIHGIGHQLGLEVHDITPDGPLKAGMVITVEPGVYLPDRKLGVRIEDDILITARGNQNLTAMIPKTVAELEAALAG